MTKRRDIAATRQAVVAKTLKKRKYARFSSTTLQPVVAESGYEASARTLRRDVGRLYGSKKRVVRKARKAAMMRQHRAVVNAAVGRGSYNPYSASQ